MAAPADFEEPSFEYDVENAWKKMRAAHAEKCGRFIQHHQNMYRAHFEKACAPSHVQQEEVDQVTSLLSRHAQLYDAPFVEDQCTRVKAWAQLVVRHGFVVKAEQHRIKKGKEKSRQRTLESAQAEYEAMDARSFVVALQLEAAGLKRLTAEDKQRGKPIQYVDQSSALGSLLVEREDMQQAYGVKVRPHSGKSSEVLHAKSLKTSRQNSLTSKSGRSNSRTSARSSSRASNKSTKSKASVKQYASGRAWSTGSSRRGSSNGLQKKSLLSVARVKAKVAVEATAKAVAEMTEAKHRGQKTAKATRAAEIQVVMWWKQAQTETSFLLAQRYRN